MSMFWAVATLTNIGHADPLTPLGKCLASVIFILGLGMFALPTAILGSGFVEEFQSRQKPTVRCPHCGRQIHFHQNGTTREEP
jgi:voltage-gated potassium channel